MTRPDAHLPALPASIREAAAGLRSGAFSAVELARAALARIERTQSTVNAFIAVTDDVALSAARAVDDELRAGRDRGPLMGMPVGIKDVFDLAGWPTTAGSAILGDAIAERDADAVLALRRAGAVIVGKTNMDQFAVGPHQEDYGRTNCPADLERYAGGSSGGSAAAIAAGCALAAIGTDAGGSVRYPASVCGVVGMKPTLGRTSLGGAFPTYWSLDHVGLLAADVAGVAVLFDALVADAGPSPPAAAPRIGVLSDQDGRYLNPTLEAVSAAIERLRAAGATVAVRTLGGREDVVPALLPIILAEGAVALAAILEQHAHRMPPALPELFAGAEAYRATDLVRAHRTRERLRAAVDGALDGLDVLATPTTREPAQRWDLPGMGDLGMGPDLPLCNLGGHPAITLPLPRAGDELPLGIQLIGRRNGDEALLATARWVERQLAEPATNPSTGT